MILIEHFFKKLGFGEFLTVLFLTSVWISLIYKYGFYSELGISWYITTSSPQELMISTISYVVFSLLGGVAGYLAIKYAQERLEVVMTVIGIIMFLFFITLHFSGGLLKGEIYIMLNCAISMLYLTKLKNNQIVSSNGELLSEKKWEDRSFGEKIFPSIFTFILVVSPHFFIFWQGKSDAKELVNPTDNNKFIFNNSRVANIVSLKDEDGFWILIEMKGDKMLIKKREETPIYKIVEYKDVKIILANQN